MFGQNQRDGTISRKIRIFPKTRKSVRNIIKNRGNATALDFYLAI